MSCINMTVRLVGLAFLLATAVPNLQAQAADWHLVSHNLFAKSAFAHGYIHGYEEGFHNGDLDLQMGRAFRDVRSQPTYKKPVGFKKEYGDKKLFEAGYRRGFAVAYVDCMWGRPFRAAELVKEAEDAPRREIAIDRTFDRAFQEGYETGEKQGLQDGRSSLAEAKASVQCEEHASQPKGSAGDSQSSYCEAFRSGYHLGYSDGFLNQKEEHILARK
ncbi:MAG TPA: hypothetical protein VN577_16600 [Terriglobales bacterium]|nr:hypothetical protein [Terriglobales bacterium]